MNELSNTINPLLPLPQANATIRPGVLSDVPFLDSLQKLHTKMVGWMPTATLEGKIKLGHVLVAECDGERVGYCIGNDQYFKRDDVGIIYQMNVMPGKQRGFIGTALLKAQFERSAYGCKLYCCWCAQDIAANKFWEAMGFVPLAFRTGSEKKGPKGSARTHIFWQKRIRAEDVTTPWWFPSQTTGGSIREDRLVLPIPPGTHWSDAMPMLLPGQSVDDVKALPASTEKRVRGKKAKKPVLMRRQFGPPSMTFIAKPERVKQPKEKQPKRKNDPKLIAAARELRDRWLEKVNELPMIDAGKYDLGRKRLPSATPMMETSRPLPRLAA